MEKTKGDRGCFLLLLSKFICCRDTKDVEESLCFVEHHVTADMNSMLLREYTTEKVELALSQMHPLKSPGPDDFAACFYQKS
jgi:hypothetical protein